MRLSKWSLCASLGQEGTDGRTSMLCQGAFLLWVGEWEPDGFRERRGKKGGHEESVEAGNWHLNKDTEVEVRVLGALPSGSFQTSSRCHSSW